MVYVRQSRRDVVNYPMAQATSWANQLRKPRRGGLSMDCSSDYSICPPLRGLVSPARPVACAAG